MIEIKHISKTYEGKHESFRALQDINLHIAKGDIFGIIGQSGAGKSTLVRCINLLERPSSGNIVIDGEDITNLAGKDLRLLREEIGMIFQHFSLFSQRTVLKNVVFPLELAGEPKQKAEARALELLELVGIAHLANRYPSELSGGQKQRVAIARALVNNPKIMLCDEATSALDTITTHQILELLKRINEALGVTIVVITHELAVVERICNKVAVIDAGRVVEEKSVEDLFAHPEHEATKILLEASLVHVSHEEKGA